MDLFEANMAAMEARHPELVEVAQGEPSTVWKVQADTNGSPNLLNTQTGRAWYTPTVAGSLSRLETRPDLRRARLVALFGLGLGHELKKIIELNANRQILVIEGDPDIFRIAVRTVDLRLALSSEQIDWEIGHKRDQLTSRLHRSCMHARYVFFLRSLAFVLSEGAATQDGHYVQEAARIFRSATVNGLNMLGNDPGDALLGLENLLQNLPLIARQRSVWALDGILKGRPAIVASAGPSLEQSLDELRRVQTRIPIFCPDTSLRILLDAGIRPHVVTSRERVEVTIRHYEGIETSGVALACVPVLKPRIFELFQGPVGLIYRSSDFHEWLQPEGEPLEFDGSAGNLAYRVAALAGCDPIVLVGQDLCFGEDGNTHAEGAACGSRQTFFTKKNKPKIEVLGNRGGTVLTSKTWLKFLNRFQLDIQAGPGRVINATARGAHIPGTEVADLGDLVNTLPLGDDPRPKIVAALTPRSDEEVALELRRFSLRIAQTRQGLRKVREIATIGQAFAVHCRENFSPPTSPDPDLYQLIKEQPYSTLDGLRQKLIQIENEVFTSYLTPIVQSTIVNIEMDRYAKELKARSADQLGRDFIDQYRAWFRDIDALIAQAEAHLNLGERSVGSSLPPELGRRGDRPRL